MATEQNRRQDKSGSAVLVVLFVFGWPACDAGMRTRQANFYLVENVTMKEEF